MFYLDPCYKLSNVRFVCENDILLTYIIQQTLKRSWPRMASKTDLLATSCNPKCGAGNFLNVLVEVHFRHLIWIMHFR